MAAELPLAMQSQDALDHHTLDWPVGEMLQHRFDSGPRHNATGDSQVVFQNDVHVAGAAWLRMYFGEVQLDGSSRIRMTSLADGEVQELDAAGMQLWRNSSAYFNGDTVRVELIAAPATFNNAVSLGSVAMERLVAGQDRGGCGICGPDDRTPSNVEWAARMMPVGCSATIYNTYNCFVTAGHCLNGADVLQFNVPASSPNCSLNNPPVADQFPVIAADGVNSGVGADYGAMKSGANNLGQTPYDRYGIFIPLASSVPSSGTASVNGFGVDEQCERTQTQQFHDGPITGTSSSAISYDIDITFGNSGSSILYNGEIIGVVSHCSSACENYGTRIDLPNFAEIREQICGVPVGACCVGTTCVVIAADNCGGTFLGEGTECTENACAPTGGCCTGTDCSITVEAECDGSYPGDDTDCLGNPCLSTGACCTDFQCAITSEASCEGVYLGDGTDCLGSPCNPTGACCTGTDCTYAYEPDCDGTWLGAGSICNGVTCSEYQFQGMAWQIVGTDLVDDDEFTWTVDVFTVLNQGERLDAVAGDVQQPKMVSTSTSFYQNTFGGPTSQSINPALFDTFPDLRYDSFVTIGSLDGDGTPFPENALSDIGIDWNEFNAGGAISTSDGTWYITPKDGQGIAQLFTDQDCNERYGVRIARLTVRGTTAQVHVEALFQGKEADGDSWQSTGEIDIAYDGTLDCNGNGAADACDIADGTSSDDNGNGIPDECESGCAGDYTGDGITNVQDLLLVIGGWDNPYDVNDLLTVIGDWDCSSP